MAVEKHFVMNDTHFKYQITSIGFHPTRREIVAGFEDGMMKWWEQDSGQLQMSTHQHSGWVTDFLFMSRPKLFFSSAHDGVIIIWGCGGNVVKKIRVGNPVYVLAHNIRRGQLVCGMNKTVASFRLDFTGKDSNIIDKSTPFKSHEHTDIVSCVLCHESRVYSAGYDGKMCIYDTTLYPGRLGISTIHKNKSAHKAGITCMILIKDNENNKWILTGSFDCSVKVWSQDGKLRQQVSTVFYDSVVSLCYLPRSKVVWIASLNQHPILFDPKSGENVTEFLPTFQFQTSNSNENYFTKLIKLRYNPESGQLIGSTSRRHLIVWRYNPAGCITALRLNSSVDSISYTIKEPLLFFSGSSDGNIYKWERLQSSHFMYSMEVLERKDCIEKEEYIRSLRGELCIQCPSTTEIVSSSLRPSLPHNVYFNKNVSLSRSIYVEELDLLVVACEDSKIYVWGFDYEAVKTLHRLGKEQSELIQRLETDCKYNVLSKKQDLSDTVRSSQTNQQHISTGNTQVTSDSAQNEEIDSVTDRVAGFICKNVLIGHTNSITSMALVNNRHLYDAMFLITSGWDRRILVWDLDENGKYHDQLRYPDTMFGSMPDGSQDDGGMFACDDGVVLNLEYCAKKNQFAYSCSDNIVYIRHFSNDGSLMHLATTLKGHDQEITDVKWNPVYDKWVTSSEDGTVRVWNENDGKLEETLYTQGLVTAICIDKVNGFIVAGVDNCIKVYDMETAHLVQKNIGHTENIRCIVHVVERSQYMSGSYDNTLRVWNAYRKPIKRKIIPNNNKCSSQPLNI